MSSKSSSNRGMTSSLARYIKIAFFSIITLLSAATSFLFFVEVFRFGRGFIADPFWSAILTGAIGVIVLDGAAIAWLKIYLGASDNNDLRALAAIGAAIGMIGSALSSFAYLVMVAAEGYQPGDNIRAYVQIAMAAIIVVHFVLVFLSGYLSTSAKIDERMAEMMSEATDEMLTLTETYFREEIPHLARTNAKALTRGLAGNFTSLTAFDAKRLPPPDLSDSTYETPPHANGRTPEQGAANGHNPRPNG